MDECMHMYLQCHFRQPHQNVPNKYVQTKTVLIDELRFYVPLDT